MGWEDKSAMALAFADTGMPVPSLWLPNFLAMNPWVNLLLP